MPQQPTKTDSTAKKVFGIHARFTTVSKMALNPDTLSELDTGLDDVRYTDPVLMRENHYTNLGNNASPSVPLFFDFERKTGFDFGFHQWDLYRMTDENMRYYNTRSAYTDFHYEQGPKDLQYFKAIHSQNITPYWNATIAYRKYFSTGFFPRAIISD